jgi:hypothetical protein
MDSVKSSAYKRGETQRHIQLKRLAMLWAQANGYSACATEVRPARCRYRVDVAAYRPNGDSIASTAIFECKQTLPDLRRDNSSSSATRARLQTLLGRRHILEKHLRIHYPALRMGDSLFAEFESHDFDAVGHRGYARLQRNVTNLQRRLFDCTKFEQLVHYRCANLFFLVVPIELFREAELPVQWGALVTRGDEVSLVRKATWQDTQPEDRLAFLHRIAAAGTRVANRDLRITFDEIMAARCRSCS